MKTLLTLMAMGLSIVLLSAQEKAKDLTSEAAVDSLKKRMFNLEKSFEESRIITNDEKKKSVKERYEMNLISLRTGLVNGTEIEVLVPAATRLLAAKDLSETLSEINNPTSKSLGTSFSDLVIESASKNLLPKYSKDADNQKAKSKFSSILGAILNSPITQSVLNSNPISSVINSTIQQAALFQKRNTSVAITKQQLKDKNDLTLPVNLENADGPTFGDQELKNFYAEIEERISLYDELKRYNNEHSVITERLYIDAGIIKKSLKGSRTEICNLLSISRENAVQDFETTYNIQDSELMKNKMNDPKFKKALSLSDYALEQLPEVREFNKSVVNAMANYIDGYIKILEDYSKNPKAKLDLTAVKIQTSKLNSIKDNFTKVN
ncbi:hypothetical protein CEQ15_11740 [Chryseobacterium indologenes]|uniref:hypothetical protein n=1 Tax=Chryseobacterium indologenes TaxID=253 RepID=UPI000B51E61C|nr:hypothetical protein [Chryseobacterium indologenes]ASE62116.1 hypothetical protein CEQ15_11740 [Chryseobacterium indologenes]